MTQPMRLLFVHQRLGAFGGAETNILLTARELEQRGCTSALLYGERTGRSTDEWESAFECRLEFPSHEKAEWVKRTIGELQPDVIYLHAVSDLQILEALIESGRPVVRMVHDHELYCMRGYKYNYFTRKPCTRAASLFCVFPCLGNLARNRGSAFPIRFQSLRDKQREIELNRRCDRFFVYSEYSRQELVRNGFEEARIHVHAPIRCDTTPEQASTFSSRNLVLFAGQIIRGKGVDALLRALALVPSPFECLILGDGNHRATCEKLARKLGLGSRVRFAGYVPQPELRSFYSEASVFAVSSLWPEPFGMTGPEAMLCGLPVVAFDVGGIREWLTDGENGFLVPWNDVRSFAVRIDQLLRDKALARELGERGRRSVSERFEATRQVETLHRIFQQLCPTRAARTPALATVLANSL